MSNDETNDGIVEPLKRLTWSEKIKNDYEWFRQCGDYYIKHSLTEGLNSSFIYESESEVKDTKEYWYNLLRDLYHNNISETLFANFSKTSLAGNSVKMATKKVRNLNMIKPNIDFIGSNYRKRNFNWSVKNTDSTSYNDFQEKYKEELFKQISQRFLQVVSNEDGSQKEADMTPESLKAKFALSYKDILAVDYQRYLTNVISECNIHEKSSEIFLDYLIYGVPISFTSINEKNKLEFRRVDARLFRYSKSYSEKYIKYSEWQVELELLTVADTVNKYGEFLTDEKYRNVINSNNADYTISSFQRDLNNVLFTDKTQRIYNKVPVYHVYFQARKLIKEISYYEEGALVTKEVSEEYKIDKETETSVDKWVNCIYTVDRIGKNYFNMGEYKYDCSDISESGKCIMPYNGFTFGHYYDDSVYSVLKLGIPYLTSFLICHYLIDKLIVKNKGKIFLMDWNAIPKTKGWDLAKFLKYADELGYAFIDRNQDGVDKSFNQYNSIDMSTLQSVFELINLAKSYQDMWDNMISVPRQLRGQSFASDEVGTTQSSVTQSGIAIDYIYQKFEDFSNSDMETILELGKYLILDGDKSDVYYGDDGIKLLNLSPEQIIASKLKLVASNNSKDNGQLEQLKEYAKINNQADPLTITEFITANNIAQLKEALTKISNRVQAQKEQEANQEQSRQMELQQVQKDIANFQLGLDKQLDDFQTDNKIRLANQTLVPSLKTDVDRDGIPDIIEAQNKFITDNRKLDIENKKIDTQASVDREKIEADKIKNRNKK